jgi:2'-5' RNA ligase
VRLFVAINLPENEKRRLADAVGELRVHELPVRWVDADSLHITLKFLGEVGDAAHAQTVAAMRSAVANHTAFQLTIASFGAFPSMSRPNIFWVGVTNPPELQAVQAGIDAEFEKIGFAREARSFTPHITIGRVKKGSAIKDRVLMDRLAGEFRYKEAFGVRSVDLMRSHLGPRGSRYEVIEKVELN